MSGTPGTISGVESEPPARADGDRIHRMSIELRRFTQERQRRSREFDQQLGSAHYRSVRAQITLTVLTRARAGTLTANWRESLALRPPEHPATMRFRLGDQLAVREVAATPASAWEPHSGATWRTALETWFDATNDAYAELEQVWTENQAAQRDRIIQQRASIARLREHLGWGRPDTRSAPPAVVDFPHAAARLHIEAWYRAGLAGGGEAVDWIGWLHDQGSEAARTVLARLGEGEGRRQLEHLPEYWHPPARRSP